MYLKSFKPHVYTSVMSDQSALPGSFSVSDERFIPDSDLKRRLLVLQVYLGTLLCILESIFLQFYNE